MIKLQIIKTIPNENYEKEVEEIKERYRFGRGDVNCGEMVRREIDKDILQVVITEAQFEAIRKAVLEKF